MRRPYATILFVAMALLPQAFKAQVSIPYSESFDTLTTAQFTAQGFTAYGCTLSVLTSSSYSCDGTKLLRMSGGGAVKNRVLVFPEFAQPINGLMLMFNTRPESTTSAYSGMLDIGYMTDATDTTTFTTLQSYDCRTFNNGCQLKEGLFASAPAGARIALRNRPNSSSWYWFVDDIEVIDTASFCHWPTTLGMSSLGTSHITLSAADTTTGNNNFVLEFDGVDMGAFSSQVTVTNLSANSQHTAIVRSLCQGDTSDRSLSLDFRTRCSYILTAPYTEGFEGYARREVPDCYTVAAGYTVGINSYPYTFIGAANAHTDSTYVRFYGPTNVLVLPRIDLPSNGMHVSFYMKHTDTSSSVLRVGLMTDPGDTSTFTPLYSVSTYTPDYTQHEFWTDAADTATASLAFFWTSTTNRGSCVVDDLRVEEPEGCRRPNAAFIDGVDTASVSLRWADAGNHNEYQIAYNTADDTATATVIGGITDSIYTVGGLDAATDYWFWVRTVCTDTTAWRPFGSARTLCPSGLLAPVHIVYGQADLGHAPLCWTPLLNGSRISVADWSYFNYGIVLEFWTSYSASTAIAMPRILLPADGMRITVTAMLDDLDPGTLEVGYVTDLSSAASFVPLGDVTATTMTTYTFNTDTVVADSLWVAFRSTSGGRQTGYAYISSIHIEALPSCEIPVWAGTEAVDDVQATVVWHPSDAYAYEVTLATFPDIDSAFQTTSTSDTSLDFLGLTASTQYYAWVRALCSGDNSEWSQPLPFRTMCAEGFCTLNIHLVDNVYEGQLFDYMAIVGMVNGEEAARAGGPGAGAVVDVAMPVCITDSVSFLWVDTSIYESFGVFSSMDYTITTGDGTLLAGGDGTGKYSGMTLLSTTSPCPNCRPPQALALEEALTTSSSLTVRWTADADANAWTVSLDGVPAATVTDTSYTFTGLAGGTPYTISVTTVCNGGTTSQATTLRATTQCPGTECEVQVDMWTESHLDVLWGGGNAVEMYKNGRLLHSATVPNGQSAATVYAPACDGDTLSLRWHAGGNGYGSQCAFRVIAPGSDTVCLGTGAASDSAMGNVVVHCGGCARPDSATVTNVTPTTATFSWPATGAAAYLLTVGDTTFSATGTTATATGLQPSTFYRYHLRSACAGDTSLALSGSFYTACGPRPLPYSEDFESAAVGLLPPCWNAPVQYPDFYGTVTPSVYRSSVNAHSGYNCLELAGLASTQPLAVSMPLTGVPADLLMVDFWLKAAPYTNIAVGIMTDPADASTFHQVYTVPHVIPSIYAHHTFNTVGLAVTDSVYHLALRYQSSSQLEHEIYIDDITVRRIPPCSEEFTSVTALPLGTDSATVSWSVSLGENSGAYYTVSLMDGNGSTVGTHTTADTSCTLSGLTPQTSYRVCVALVCGGGLAATSDTVDFTTATAECPVPTVDSAYGGEDFVSLSFSSQADSVELVLTGVQEPTQTIVTAAANATFGNLTPGTAYTVALRALCTGGTSAWDTVTVSTAVVDCFAPTALSATDITFTSATLGWTAGGDETAWNIHVYNTVFDLTRTSTATSFTVDWLTPGSNYSVEVQALCGQHSNIAGPWSEPLAFSTETCLPVSDVTVSVADNNSATVGWTAGANGNGTWLVEYGPAGFSRGEGQTHTATTNPSTIDGLEPNSDYDIYVASVCVEGVTSVYSERVSFSTGTGGIGTADGGLLRLYPNPADRSVTVETVAGTRLTIADQSGRIVLEATLPDRTTTINTEGLPAGAYFLRTVNGNGTSVRKLIIR